MPTPNQSTAQAVAPGSLPENWAVSKYAARFNEPNDPAPSSTELFRVNIYDAQSLIIQARVTGASKETAREKAAFIVTACNSHAGLVAALQAVASLGLFSKDNLKPEEYTAIIQQARSALTAAKG